MKPLERAAIVVALLKAMENRGSWCGGTHLQKAVYFLQQLCDVPTNYRFILYKHGPYSFELDKALTRMRAVAILTLKLRKDEYGPSYAQGELSEVVTQKHADVIAKYMPQVDFVSQRLGDKGVAELEPLATALFVRNELGTSASLVECAEKIEKLKPHIPFTCAIQAVETIDKWVEELTLPKKQNRKGKSKKSSRNRSQASVKK